MYSYNERNGVQSLINVLEPFKIATEMLSSDKIPTHVLTVSANDSHMIREVRIVMKGQLDNRTTDTDITLIACKLTPSMHHMCFATEGEKAEAIELLYKELMKCFSVTSNVKQEQTRPSEVNNNHPDPPLPNMNFDEELKRMMSSVQINPHNQRRSSLRLLSKMFLKLNPHLGLMT
ncbi:hypothetical protein MAR_007349 [Mya arenaria]|uniref:Uncharacterized protein n=1 Tax=Mya arenaria TaxID=6604 RepID=A0ABY7DC69_MYAAR|nr:hypothetical protein MAR_007349 [Mya arenaria]